MSVYTDCEVLYLPIYYRAPLLYNDICTLNYLVLVIKRIEILLYRENLNKSKIYIRRIFNTDRKSLL